MVTMKCVWLVFLLASTFAICSGRDDVRRLEFDNYGIDDMIMSFIEGIRNQLKEGIPEQNIPPLDPMDIKHQDIMISVGDALWLNGSVENVTGSNLLSFNVSELNAKVTPIYLEIRLNWGAIDVKGLYDLDGHLLNIIPIYGNGSFEGYFDGAFAYLKLEIGTKAAKLKLKKFEVDFGIRNVSVSIENFLGGLLGEVICEMINENLPTMLEQFKIGYLPGIKEFLVNEINKFIDGKTMDELLDILLGFLTTTTTTTTTASPPTPSSPPPTPSPPPPTPSSPPPTPSPPPPTPSSPPPTPSPPPPTPSSPPPTPSSPPQTPSTCPPWSTLP